MSPPTRSDRFELVQLESGRWEVVSTDYHASYRARGATAVEALLALADQLLGALELGELQP